MPHSKCLQIMSLLANIASVISLHTYKKYFECVHLYWYILAKGDFIFSKCS